MQGTKAANNKLLVGFGVILGAVVVAAALILADWFIFSRAEAEIHLIPEGYVGPVVIAFDRDDGEPKRYENGSRVYVIPPSGILKIRLPRNDGTHHVWKFRYVKSDGTTRELPHYLDVRSVPEKDGGSIAVYSIASLSAPTSKADQQKSFFTYVVGNVVDSKLLIDKQHSFNFGDL